MATPQMGSILVYLNNLRFVRIKLRIGKIGTEQKQSIAMFNHVEPRLSTQHAVHTHIERVIIFDKIFRF